MEKDIFVLPGTTVKDALKKLNQSAKKVLLVVDKKGRLLGALTDGDVRRYILSGKNLNDIIENVFNKNPQSLNKKDLNNDVIKNKFVKHKLELLPILDDDNKVVDFITWDKFFSDKAWKRNTKSLSDMPVVIMAGGEGTRLDPFTRILPKPLIPIGEKPMIEVIIDNFRSQGAADFKLILNYKGEMIRSYFDYLKKDYDLKYFWEDKLRGTASSLDLLKNKIKKSFIVSNCDVLVRADFKDVLEYHKAHKAVLTVLSSVQHHKIPYGVIDFIEGGEVLSIVEKPEYTFVVNTGVYVLEPKALKFIPSKKMFNMTDLIEALIKKKEKVITYPVNENDYVDAGKWDEYKTVVDKLKSFV